MLIRSALLIALLSLAACGERRASVLELGGSTMGTSFSVKLPALPPQVDPASLRTAVDAVLLAIEMQMSTYRVDSEISRFNVSDSTDWHAVSEEFCRATEESLAISRQTDGTFDITVGPLVNLWGFGPDGDVRQPPSASDIEAARSRVGFTHLHTDCSKPAIRKDIARLYLDMSAYAKGYAVDRVAKVLDQVDAQDYLVEIGGEMRLRGRNADGDLWAVAVEEPLRNERRVHAVFRLTDQSVATSGDYRNYFESGGQSFSHAIDTRTGRPVTHNLASVTVVAKTAAVADAMATALLVLGPDDGVALAEAQGIAALFLVRDEDGIKEIMSPAFDLIGAKL